jgi:hypothetical protein
MVSPYVGRSHDPMYGRDRHMVGGYAASPCWGDYATMVTAFTQRHVAFSATDVEMDRVSAGLVRISAD